LRRFARRRTTGNGEPGAAELHPLPLRQVPRWTWARGDRPPEFRTAAAYATFINTFRGRPEHQADVVQINVEFEVAHVAGRDEVPAAASAGGQFLRGAAGRG
jgi:hypothetical protein